METEKEYSKEPIEERIGKVAPEAEGLKAEGKMRKENSTKRINKLWLWLGIIVLIIILVWWLFSIGTFEAIVGTANG